ncbi:hypothetical protein JOL79_24405 [Microbispora sp. RL4-1S]|uniref:Transposase n=1 Tax=Microbispora oryzae TaxID=2806554 RepID=A0A941AM37_9ACTN|nr:hypothetical protein [Microbispora oryzae]
MRIAGIRWTVEESFQAVKGQVGLDHYQVRSWDGWHRRITLAMLALAFLAALAASQPDGDEEHLPLTMPEIRRLLAALALTRHRRTEEILHWSHWRRRHQATARRCHYQRRSQRVNISEQHPAACKAPHRPVVGGGRGRRRCGPQPAPGRAAEDPHLPDQRLRVLPAHAHPRGPQEGRKSRPDRRAARWEETDYFSETDRAALPLGSGRRRRGCDQLASPVGMIVTC